MFRLRDLKNVTGSHFPPFLTVDDENGGGAGIVWLHFRADRLVSRQDDRSAAQHKRADWGDQDSFQTGMDKRAAGRKRISGGAGRCGKDEAVCLVGGDIIVISFGGQVEQAICGILADHHVIEGVPVIGWPSVSEQTGLKHRSEFHGNRSTDDSAKCRLGFSLCQFGKETEVAQVNSDYRDFIPGSGFCNVEKGSVTTEDYPQVEIRGPLIESRLYGQFFEPSL